MSLIIKSKVYSAKKKYICDDCYKYILKNEKYRYLYGAPDIGDKPYSLRVCKDCDTFKEEY